MYAIWLCNRARQTHRSVLIIPQEVLGMFMRINDLPRAGQTCSWTDRGLFSSHIVSTDVPPSPLRNSLSLVM
jgi:hypothetical protein